MKIFTFCAVAAYASASTLCAQGVPNGGFENWKNQNHEEPEIWAISGKTSKVAGVSSGNAIRLSNDNQSGNFGVVSMVKYDTGAFYAPAFAYTTTAVPDSVIFVVRCNLGGDTASVSLAFTKAGLDFPVSAGNYRIQGSSNLWQTLTFPIEYINPTPSLVPDSGYLVIASADEVFGPSGNGYIEIDRISFKYSNNSSAADIPNHSFENWHSASLTSPQDWVTSQELSFLQQSTGNFTSRSPDKYSGNYALQLQSFESSDPLTGKNDTIPGFAISNRNGAPAEDADVFKPAFAVSQRYTSFRGFLKTQLGDEDVATVLVNLFSADSIVASAFYMDGTNHGYSEFSADFTWDTSFTGTPDSASIALMVSDSGMTTSYSPGTSTAWFDDLRFDNWNARIAPVSVIKSKVWPNPSQGQAELRIQLPGSENIAVCITGLNGQMVWNMNQQLHRGNHIIPLDLNHVNPGIYTLSIQSFHWNQKHTIIIAK